MRTAFIQQLALEARRNPRIFLVVGDLGYSVVEPFAQEFPDRFLNAGVAEQNMTAIAAGLASEGYVAFTYSIANFPTIRCLEQIRNDICYHNLDVKIVAVGGGLAYGSLGYSHHGVEDLGIMRLLPNMTVVAPGDPIETRLATCAIIDQQGPCYLRLGKAGEPTIHTALLHFEIGKAILLRDGTDLSLISTGGMLATVQEVAVSLAERGINARVLSMATLQPLDTGAILQAAKETKAIITIEEHGYGGLGTVVAEVLAGSQFRTRFVPIRLTAKPSSICGSQQALLKLNGITTDRILKVALGCL